MTREDIKSTSVKSSKDGVISTCYKPIMVNKKK